MGYSINDGVSDEKVAIYINRELLRTVYPAK